MPEPTETTQIKLKKFLEVYAKKGVVAPAAKASGLDRSTIYTYRDSDPAFAQAMKRALDDFIESLEAEAHRRAVTGTLKPVYQNGKRVGQVRQFSDSLLILMLKAHKPALYKEPADGGPKVPGGVIQISINAPATAVDPGAADE